MIVKNESSDFVFCCLITFMFIKTVFFFSISFFKLEISEDHVLREMAQTLRDLTLTVNHEESTFKTFSIISAKLLSPHKLRNIFSFKCFFIFYCI